MKRPGKSPTSPTAAGRTLSKEEDALWRHVSHEVKPLTERKLGHRTLKSDEQAQHTIPNRKRPLHAPTNKIISKHAPHSHGQAPGLDKRTQLRLRRGQVKIEAKLDLHGMTQMEAHDVLVQFIEDSVYRGRRSVLVITGKGLRADGRTGVLRNAVPRWLNDPSVRPWIKAFDHAALRDGGEGALYVLLRRRK